jgi:hypothetical protein
MKLGVLGFNPHRMLVVDLMHEFELGVWRTTFTHIIRVLYAAVPSGQAVSELNKRYFNIWSPLCPAELITQVPPNTYFWAGYYSTLL